MLQYMASETAIVYKYAISFRYHKRQIGYRSKIFFILSVVEQCICNFKLDFVGMHRVAPNRKS